MKIDIKDFRVRPGEKLKLKDMPTRIKPLCASGDDYKQQLVKHVKQLAKLQELLYGSNTYALLLIFQGMDAPGKDGAISHVMSGVNPQGCDVTSFKQPSAAELEHDFLGRTYARLPARGKIGIFNRSYYEEVLVTRVHPELLVNEGVAGALQEEGHFWKQRYHSIVEMEKHLHRNGTRIVKFFLHLSKEEQKTRFLARIDDPDKNWKFGSTDIQERKFWKRYMDVYEDCLRATSTGESPWYAVPADDKADARLIVSQIVVDALSALKMNYPRTTPKRHEELLAVRKLLEE